MVSLFNLMQTVFFILWTGMKGVYKSRGTLEETLHPTREAQEETNQLKAVQGQSVSFWVNVVSWFDMVFFC